MQYLLSIILVLFALFLGLTRAVKLADRPSRRLLEPATFRHYFVQFSRDEKAMLGSSGPLPWEWFEQNIPWLDVPD